MTKAEGALIFLLRAEGIVLLLALPFVFLPTEVLAAIHTLLGLGEFPRARVVEYMVRSASGLYAMWGPLHLYLAADVRRYLSLIWFLSLLKVVFGVGMLVLDWWVGMPVFWTVGEGPTIAVLAVVVLELVRRVRRTV